ncbi:MAG: hypothetical protein K2J80_08250 [Oscillospiraceae bacterium]|nr:hypothetical protein [Oscillospiraceae bacterium]
MGDLRVGRVSAVDAANLAARVRFDADDVTSGWLKILQTPPGVAATGRFDDDGDEKDVEITVTVSAWMPAVGETVVCIYGEGFNADGYIIGGLK